VYYLIQKVGESIGVNHFMQRPEVLPNGLEHGAEDEDVVEGRQADEDPVEAGGQSFAQEDGDSHAVSGQADHSDYYLRQ
jgi:hypothetical protein